MTRRTRTWNTAVRSLGAFTIGILTAVLIITVCAGGVK